MTLARRHTAGDSTPARLRLAAAVDWIAVAVILAALARCMAAGKDRSLGPDETLHFEMANQTQVRDVYWLSRWNAHPPLFFLILRLWLGVGKTEFFLRLLPAISVGALLWFSYRWGGRLMGRASGLLTLLVFSAAPALLPLAEEVRGYSLLLFLCVAALAEFELSLATGSSPRMALSGLALLLAALTHFSALFVVGSAFVYAILRFRSARPRRRVLGVWAGFQVASAVVYLFLYFTQVTALRGGELERHAMTVWLDTSYFNPGRESALRFVAVQTAGVFLYLFGSPVAAAVAFIFAAAGVLSLARKRNPAALLLVLPFMLGAAAGLLRLYPFGGTRHSVYLFPFAAAAIGAAAPERPHRGIWELLLLIPVVVPLLWGSPAWSSSVASIAARNSSVERLRKVAPPGSLVFAEFRTATLLGYALGREVRRPETPGLAGLWEKAAGPYCIVRPIEWTLGPEALGDQIEALIRSYRLERSRFWIVRWGPEYDLPRVLARRFPASVVPVSPPRAEFSIVEVWP